MAAVEVVQDEDQLMSLKVMRLSRPEFEIRSDIYFEVDEEKGGIPFLPGLSQQKEVHNTNFELSPVLSLPNPSDTIYLGETFSCYISVNNETDKVLQHMTLKVELQATYRHFSLVDTTINPQDILSNDSAQFIVHHEVKELGMHFLLCSVHYVTTNQERKFFKKIYKINVLNPLAVKTKANNLKGGGAVLLEVQVQNLSTSTMYLDNMKFEPNSVFNYHDLNFIFDDSNNGLEISKNCIESNDIIGPSHETSPINNSVDSEEIHLELEKLENKEILEPTEELDNKINEDVDEIKEPWEIELPSSPTEENREVKLEQQEEDMEAVNEQNEDNEEKEVNEEKEIIEKNQGSGEKDISTEEELSEEKDPSEEKETRDSVANHETVNSTQVNESEKNKVMETASNFRKELFGNLNYLKPKDVRQYLYKLEPKDPIDNSAYISNELGKLDIIWKTSFGGSGRLQTSQLTRRAPQIELIDLKVIEVQKQIYLDCPFFIELKLQNRGDKVMHIELSTERLKMTSILYKGVSPRDLGPIAPGGLINFKLEFLPLSPGPHKLGGIKIMDMFTHNVAEFDQIAEVFISN